MSSTALEPAPLNMTEKALPPACRTTQAVLSMWIWMSASYKFSPLAMQQAGNDVIHRARASALEHDRTRAASCLQVREQFLVSAGAWCCALAHLWSSRTGAACTRACSQLQASSCALTPEVILPPDPT